MSPFTKLTQSWRRMWQRKSSDGSWKVICPFVKPSGPGMDPMRRNCYVSQVLSLFRGLSRAEGSLTELVMSKTGSSCSFLNLYHRGVRKAEGPVQMGWEWRSEGKKIKRELTCHLTSSGRTQAPESWGWSVLIFKVVTYSSVFGLVGHWP